MTLSQEEAESIAIKGLQYLAGDEEQLSRFLALSGCQIDDLRQNVSSPQFLAGVLEYFLGNEPTLLAFSAGYSLDPTHVGMAQYILAGASTPGLGEFMS